MCYIFGFGLLKSWKNCHIEKEGFCEKFWEKTFWEAFENEVSSGGDWALEMIGSKVKWWLEPSISSVLNFTDQFRF